MRQTIFFVFSCLFLVACGIEEISEHGISQSGAKDISYLSSTPTNIDISSESLVDESSYLNEQSYLENYQTNYTNKTSTSFALEGSSKVKQVDNLIYQTVIEAEDSISFYTWEGDQRDVVTIIDMTIFNDQEMTHGLQIGKFYYQLWHENVNFFLSYHDLELDLTFIDEAENGKIPTSKINIGMSEEDLISLLGDPVTKDWYHGGNYYQYNEQAFILDDHLNVVAIKMPGNRIKIPLKDVTAILGKPTEIIFDELDNSLFYSYVLDNFTLSFEAEDAVKQVRNIWVMENE